MVRIFDLPPGGLADGSVAQGVAVQGNPINREGKMVGIFSDNLLEQISKTVNEKKQVILFQNRRGFSPIIECNKR